MTALVADTGGLLRALARRPDGKPSFPNYEKALRQARAVVVPALVLAEVDYFLREHRTAMRKLIAEIFDPATTYEFEPTSAVDIVRALELDSKFANLDLGLVDGVVAAVCERRRVHRVLTIDHEDFGPLRVGPRWNVRLHMVP